MQREGLDTRMSKIAIVTDSNSGITQAEGARRGIHVLPMPFMIDEVTYYEDIDLTQEQFYEKLKSGANIAKPALSRQCHEPVGQAFTGI